MEIHIKSTSNTYTFANLKSGNYRIIVKVIDTNGIYSNIYVVNEKIISSSSNLIRFTYAGTEYSAEKGMTFTQWAESEYNTFGYYIVCARILRFCSRKFCKKVC